MYIPFTDHTATYSKVQVYLPVAVGKYEGVGEVTLCSWWESDGDEDW